MEVSKGIIHEYYDSGYRIACCTTIEEHMIGIAKQIVAKRLRVSVTSLAAKQLFNGNIEVFTRNVTGV